MMWSHNYTASPLVFSPLWLACFFKKLLKVCFINQSVLDIAQRSDFTERLGATTLSLLNKGKDHLLALGTSMTAAAPTDSAVAEVPNDREKRKNAELSRIVENARAAICEARNKPMHISLIVSAFVAAVLAIEEVCQHNICFKKNLPLLVFLNNLCVHNH